MTRGANRGQSAVRTKGVAIAASLLVAFGSVPSGAEERWNPFREEWSAPAPRSDRRPPAPAVDAGAQRASNQASSGVQAAPLAGFSDEVERGELAPIVGADAGAGQGDAATVRSIEALLNGLEVPSRSPALSVLLRRFLSGISGNAPELLVLKAEALYRSGLLRDGAELLAGSRARVDPPTLSALRARYDIALGRHDNGCAAAKAASARRAELTPALRGEMIAVQGYCAAAAGDKSATGLAAGLAREEGGAAPQTLAALEAVALGQKVRTTADDRLSPLDYRLLRFTGTVVAPDLAERAEPALLAALVDATDAEPALKAAAAEAAARVNIIEPRRLADIYHEQKFAPRDLMEPLHARVAPALRRPLLLQSAEFERNPSRKSRAIRALADEARRGGLYLQVLALLADQVDSMTPAHEIGWFSETAVEVLLAAGRFERAARWAAFGTGPDRRGPGSLEHWLALIDIADRAPAWRRGEYLGSLEELALRGRFSPEALVRVATVLDALDYQVPMRLWEAAGRSPQPGGHLPETGVLSELQAAAKGRDSDRTMLLAIRALGPAAAEGAHVIALADTIRALKQVGLEADARRIGFEALFAVWPRTVHN
jgi:hypothetical protein